MNTDNLSSPIESIVNIDSPVIAWWSGGITSAVACHLAIKLFGSDNVKIVFIDTMNEDDDTYRFKIDCEKWYGKEIETISMIPKRFENIQDVWIKYLSLNISGAGASCSLRLKRYAREEWEKENKWSYQVFGFDIDEPKRARALRLNQPHVNPFFPLLALAIRKKDCIEELNNVGIKIPRAYHYGFHNNNCFKTGCIQGGIGYWQKMQREFPDKFDAMAIVEHELTNLKGEPVTMLKDQSKGGGLVFLKPHPQYPDVKDISMMKGREPKPLFECNGFCGTNDLMQQSTTYNEINFTNHV